ncbi:hypothetical protein V5799_007237 [Amblyomma americanum]|uniref:Uncharacterized protein n=1 Tax=Amblyomma americanum TaxID=6943 RepID=A0AAQ4DU43_AMBAM
MREYLRTLDSYDLDRCEWRNHSSMNVPRAYVAAAALGEHIYAVGGHTDFHQYAARVGQFLALVSAAGTERTSSAERYSPHTNQWTMIARMSRRRSDGSACAFKVLRSEPGLPLCWRKMPRLNTPRSTFAVAQLGGDLYVIGGFNGTSLISDVERYTPGDICWYRITPLNQPVSALSGCAVTGVELMRKFSARVPQYDLEGYMDPPSVRIP